MTNNGTCYLFVLRLRLLGVKTLWFSEVVREFFFSFFSIGNNIIFEYQRHYINPNNTSELNGPLLDSVTIVCLYLVPKLNRVKCNNGTKY